MVSKARWAGKNVLNYLSPIVAYGEQVGFWVIRYDLTTLNYQTLEILALFSALILSVSLLLGVLLNKILLRFVVDPVLALQQAMHDIGAEKSDSEPMSKGGGSQTFVRMVSAFDQHTESLSVSAATKDEIGSLAYTFRHMLVALKNAYADIRTDPLTRLANRLNLDECLAQAVELAWSEHIAVSVILIDIDFFKKVNDTYGHLVGDGVLKQLAQLFTDNLAPQNIPGRWGGEEFLIVLPGTEGDRAAMVAEQLRTKISCAQFASVGRVTASFGVSSYTRGDSIDRLLKRTDTALYQAKEEGRNKVVALF